MTISQAFSLSAVGPGPAILLNDQSTASVVLSNVGGGCTIVPQVTSDSPAAIQAGGAQWVTATTIGSGSITTAGTYVGNVADFGLTGFRIFVSALTSGTISGSIAASDALGLSGGGAVVAHVITDAGSVTNATLQAGSTTTVTQATGSNLHTQVDAGAAIIGKVGIDQTTPGTTNGVQVVAALPAGTNIVGKVTTDQTTPGTTDLVHAAQQGTWTIQPGNTANTTAWKVDGSAVTQPVLATSATATLTQIASSATTVSLLVLNTLRKGYSAYNDSTQIAYIAHAATASTTAYTVQVPSQGFYEQLNTAYTGPVSALWASANGSMRLTEYT